MKKKKGVKSSTLKAPSLVKEIVSDVFIKHWYITLLAILTITSAMILAKTSHESRRAIALSQILREERQQNEIEFQGLRLEITSLSEANRISSLAKKELKMIDVNTNNEKIITL